MHLSRTRLRQFLGALWLLDGVLQLQPQMFTATMVHSVLDPLAAGQPGVIGTSLRWITQVGAAHLTALNLGVAAVQIALGLLLLTGKWVRPAILASVVWALAVWYGGEGMSMILTGQASVLTGFPGAVLLYPLLGVVVYPRRAAAGAPDDDGDGLLPRRHLSRILGGLFVVAALLQLQPYWWQTDQLSQAIQGMVGGGGLNGTLLDPALRALAELTAGREIAVNLVLVVIFLGVGLALLRVGDDHRRPVLLAVLVVAALIWYAAQALGMVFTGLATDPNSGLLLILVALASWPTAMAAQTAARRVPRTAEAHAAA